LHETQPLLSVEPDRIGHGTFLVPELAGGSELADAVLAANIPLGIYCVGRLHDMFYADLVSTLSNVFCAVSCQSWPIVSAYAIIYVHFICPNLNLLLN